MEINPFAQRALYEEEKVITMYDLGAIRNGYIYQYNSLPKWRFYKRWQFRIGMGVIAGVMGWLKEGKPGLAGNDKETVQ